LDQTVLAGVGNIYADESLWGARIHPSTRVGELTDEQFKVLHTELLMVLRLAIEKGGSTDRNYVNAEGKKGSYLSFARVFRRQGQACPRCGTTILKTTCSQNLSYGSEHLQGCSDTTAGHGVGLFHLFSRKCTVGVIRTTDDVEGGIKFINDNLGIVTINQVTVLVLGVDACECP
jgi:hypothetical protein